MSTVHSNTMPLLEVSCGVRLHYQISYCNDDPSQVSLRPWLMILHPLLLDSSYLDSFAEEPQIRKSFNRILFDARHHGRSQTAPSIKTDLYTLASDFAIGLDKLQIPAVHAIGSHVWSAEILLRMAALFPSKIISLCLSSLLPPVLEPFFVRAFQECFEYAANPNSVEEWDETIAAIQWFNFGDPSLIDQDFLDEWAAVLVRRIPPSRSVDCFLCTWPFIGACQSPPSDFISDDLKASITHPILVLRGENDSVFTEAGCQSRLNELPNPHGHTTMKSIKGGPLLLFRTHVEQARTSFMDWISPILAGKFAEYPPDRTSTHRQSGLAKLALHCKDDSIRKRDPLQSNSYHCKTKESIVFAEGLVEELKVKQQKAFSLFGGGAPELWTGAGFQETVPWRFSSRFDDARLGISAPALQYPKCDDSQIKEISIDTFVQVEYQSQLGI